MASTIENNCGIILAMFGTSSETGLTGLLNIRDRMEEKFPHTPVRMAFASNIIRKKWHKRACDASYRKNYPGVPEEIFHIKSPGAVMKEFLDQGIDELVLQPVQIAPAINGSEIRPSMDGMEKKQRDELLSFFRKIGVGRPALGALGSSYPCKEDMARVVRSLASDFDAARKEGAALFYMGHGNRLPETDRVYNELVEEIRHQYPDVPMVMSMVEGPASVNDLTDELKHHNVNKIILKAFMVTAGHHARKDMAGEGPETLKDMLEKESFSVLPDMTGLGELPLFADIFVQHAEDAAHAADIKLM